MFIFVFFPHPDTFIPRPEVPVYATTTFFFAKIFNEDGTFRGQHTSEIYNDIEAPHDFVLHTDSSNTVHIKPNDILTQQSIPKGTYALTFDFFRNIFD